MAEVRKNKFKLFVIITAIVALVIIIVFPGSSVIEGIRAHHDIKSWGRQIEQLNQDIDRMQGEIDELKSDPDTLEKFAREHFQFAAPGDDVYIIEK